MTARTILGGCFAPFGFLSTVLVAIVRAKKASAAPVSDGMQIAGVDPKKPPGTDPGGVKRDAKSSSASCMVWCVLYQNHRLGWGKFDVCRVGRSFMIFRF